jgi:DNA-binding NarL/FixJ family response regulator
MLMGFALSVTVAAGGRRLMTELHKGALSAKQHLVINLLATGHTISDAASIAGISRSSISNWLNHIPLFRETLNKMRMEVKLDQQVQNR